MRGGRNSDFFFAEKQTNEETVATLVQYCKEKPPTVLPCRSYSGYPGADAYAKRRVRRSQF